MKESPIIIYRSFKSHWVYTCITSSISLNHFLEDFLCGKRENRMRSTTNKIIWHLSLDCFSSPIPHNLLGILLKVRNTQLFLLHINYLPFTSPILVWLVWLVLQKYLYTEESLGENKEGCLDCLKSFHSDSLYWQNMYCFCLGCNEEHRDNN